jgi:hypothetical protein
VGVRVWRPHWSADGFDVLSRQEGVEGARELRVAVEAKATSSRSGRPTVQTASSSPRGSPTQVFAPHAIPPRAARR